MVCVCRSKDKDYSEKTHFFFLKLETPESHFGFPFVCFYAFLFAVRAPRLSRYGAVALSLRRNGDPGGPYGNFATPEMRVKKAERASLLFRNEKKEVQKIKKEMDILYNS